MRFRLLNGTIFGFQTWLFFARRRWRIEHLLSFASPRGRRHCRWLSLFGWDLKGSGCFFSDFWGYAGQFFLAWYRPAYIADWVQWVKTGSDMGWVNRSSHFLPPPSFDICPFRFEGLTSMKLRPTCRLVSHSIAGLCIMVAGLHILLDALQNVFTNYLKIEPIPNKKKKRKEKPETERLHIR